MSATQLLVTLAGFGIIVLIIWYFWLWKSDEIAAHIGKDGVQVIDVTVKGGYQPSAIVIKAGKPLRLNFTRREASLCGEEVVLPEFGKRVHLPENITVPVEIPPSKPGEYDFMCGMNMYKGKLIAR